MTTLHELFRGCFHQHRTRNHLRIRQSHLLVMCLCITTMLGSCVLYAQRDPGPRRGASGAGGPYDALSASEKTFFTNARDVFAEIDSVSGTISGEDGSGLGPTFNANGCAACHAQPDVGGSSPGLASPQHPMANPQITIANLDLARNTIPSFITSNGPVREARFIRNPDGTPDGGVHGLFTIAGRTDANGCNLLQPDFATAVANNNIIFRIPTPVFGLGLVENTPDDVLRTNLALNQSQKAALGIGGVLNTSGNDGTVTRFGWKAQNKSLMIFAGEAYNVEQGVSNENFLNERSAVNGCVFNATPEDVSHIVNPNNNGSTGTLVEMSSDLVNFAGFMRLSAPPAPAAFSASAQNGANMFFNIGCAFCHSTTLNTAASRNTGMGNVAYHPYSDFAIHHMGSGLSDGVSQGAAGPDQFRTAPLWGVGQRLFFLHDGRTSDLTQAIAAHSSTGSEANRVITTFNALPASTKQDILNFLRAL